MTAPAVPPEVRISKGVVVAELKYQKALKKLDEIIARIENEDIDVDELAARVKEAVALISLCRKKIENAKLQVRQVVEEFAREAQSLEEQDDEAA